MDATCSRIILIPTLNDMLEYISAGRRRAFPRFDKTLRRSKDIIVHELIVRLDATFFFISPYFPDVYNEAL